MTDQELIEALRGFSSPTISNALAELRAGDPTLGFSDGSLDCLFPDLGPMSGVAMTVEIETVNPGVTMPGPGPLFLELLGQIDALDVPAVVVAHEVGTSGTYAAHCGEVLAASLKAVGAIGVVTDGAVRDVEAIRGLGIHVFSRGVVPSSGAARLVRLGRRVSMGRLQVGQGDILHLDANGLVVVPRGVAERVPPVAQQIVAAERDIVNYTKSDGFTLQGLIDRLGGGPG
jgi:regulator of RNase E activity RraA